MDDMQWRVCRGSQLLGTTENDDGRLVGIDCGEDDSQT